MIHHSHIYIYHISHNLGQSQNEQAGINAGSMSTTDEWSKCVEPRSRRDYVTSLTLPWPAVLLQRWNLMVAASCGATSQLEVIADRPFRSRIMLDGGSCFFSKNLTCPLFDAWSNPRSSWSMSGRLSPLVWPSLQSAATGESLPGEHWKELASNKSRTPREYWKELPDFYQIECHFLAIAGEKLDWLNPSLITRREEDNKWSSCQNDWQLHNHI